MANLFTVFTPFQLFVAQQVINQEKLTDNILLEGYIEGNPHFMQIYDLMYIDSMWSKKIAFPELPRWDGNRNSSLKEIQHSYHNYKKICKIVQENNVNTLYLSEIQNTSQRFLNILFAHKGKKIVYFEEGGGHYIQRPYRKESLSLKIKEWVRDLTFYLPIYHVRFAKWRYVTSRPIEGELPINVRYSIIPQFHETFDRQLFPKQIISAQLSRYLKDNILEGNEKRVLFMTDPVEELIGKANIHLYYETIKECFQNIDRNIKVYLKYHPRDSKESQIAIEGIADQCGLNYSVISNSINVPVEYYLQLFKFQSVYIFNSVTFFYNGYVYPKQNFVMLLPVLYQKCLNANIPKRKRDFLLTMIEKMKALYNK